jgi:PBSX family phage terminase large subunit
MGPDSKRSPPPSGLLSPEVLRRLPNALRPILTRPPARPASAPDAAAGPRFEFRGGCLDGYRSRDPELLLSGPAGTGKTLANLAFCHAVAEKYPQARLLFLRKTRASLTDSALVTYERDVLGPAHPVLRRSAARRENRYSYRYPNGSEVVLGGMDKPDKVLSSEYDLIYVPEATDLTVTDWETLSGRLRSGVVPYQQMRGDCNPTTPTHWLYQRCLKKLCRLVQTTHRDNPRYWDAAAGDWTEKGRQYLDRLGRMTGNRRVRFLEGRWARAEGVVFDAWDPEVHVVDRFDPPRSWRRHLSIDWGYTNPACVGLWVEDGDGRLYLFREIYRPGALVSELAEVVKGWFEHDQPRPALVVGDHSATDRATFERHSGLRVRLADKRADITGETAGVQDVADRLAAAGDGRPRLFVMRDALVHDPDPTLIDAGKPTCTEQEFDGYVWDPACKKGERPLKQNDHGMDQTRYLCKFLSARGGGGGAATGTRAQTVTGDVMNERF